MLLRRSSGRKQSGSGAARGQYGEHDSAGKQRNAQCGYRRTDFSAAVVDGLLLTAVEDWRNGTLRAQREAQAFLRRRLVVPYFRHPPPWPRSSLARPCLREPLRPSRPSSVVRERPLLLDDKVEHTREQQLGLATIPRGDDLPDGPNLVLLCAVPPRSPPGWWDASSRHTQSRPTDSSPQLYGLVGPPVGYRLVTTRWSVSTFRSNRVRTPRAQSTRK